MRTNNNMRTSSDWDSTWKGPRLRATIALVVSLTWLALGPAAAAQKKGPTGTVPATGVFADASPGLRGDAAGVYSHDEDCAKVTISASGLYHLRTVAVADECMLEPVRFFSLDFGSPQQDVDQDGEAEAVESAYGRLLADDAFAKGANTTPVIVFIFETTYDAGGNASTTATDPAWQLTYQNPARITPNADGSRTIELLEGEADAALCEVVLVVGKGGKIKQTCEPRGTYSLPFRLTAAPK